jgi:hypothetical protein
MFKLRGIPLLLLVVAGLAIPGSALAAPPSNDAFAAAEELTGRTATVSALNKDATKEVGEPDHAGEAGGASVWYRWTAPASGFAKLSTCGSEFDTLLAAYTGDSVDALVEVDSNNDSCGTRSSVSFAAEEGVTYRIAVDGTNGSTGGFTLALHLGPANDDFADAVELTGDTGSVDGTNVGASREAGEPEYLGNSVWYRWTAPSNGWATFETCGVDFDSVLTVFTGSQLADLREIAWSDDCGYSSRATFEVTAGVTYSIALFGYDGAEGEFQLAWNRNAPPPEPPEPPYAFDYPTIAGVFREGQTLTASEGEWFGATPISFAYAWVRCNTNGTSCFPIGGATSRTYALSGADVDHRLRVVVTGSNVAGSSSEVSYPTEQIRPSGPTNTAAPQVSGEARVGEALFADAGTWTGLQPIQYAYQWQECDTAGNACLDLQGETSSVLEVRAQHVDSRLRVVVTASNADGPRSAVSDPSSVVAPPRQQPRRCVVPNIRGKQLAAARKAITKAQCRVGRIQRKFSNRVRADRVISQTPRPRARLASRARVHLVVSKGRRR